MSENFSFEHSLSELEKIVSQLEKENCTLDEAIELFEQGVALTKSCNEHLNNAKIKIETLTNKGEDSND